MRLLKTILLFIFFAGSFSFCTQSEKKKNFGKAGNQSDALNGKQSGQVEKDTPPVVIPVNEKSISSISVSPIESPKPPSDLSYPAPDVFVAGIPRKVSPGQDSTELPIVVPAGDSSFFAIPADIDFAKDMVQNTENPFAFSYFGKLQGLRHDVVKCLIEDRKGNLWIGTGGGGASRYNGSSFSHYSEKQGVPSPQVFSLAEDRAGNIWMGTFGGGICKYDGRNISVFTHRQGLSSDKVLCMLEDKAGYLWIGTYGGGLCRYDGRNFTTYTMKQGLPGNVIVSLTQDKAGNIWIGTNGEGLCKFDGKSFSCYTSKEGLSGNVILSLFCDKKGDLWIGTEGSGVTRFNGNNFFQFTTKQGLADNSVLCITEDKDGKILLGTFRGLCIFDGNRINGFPEAEGSPRNSIFCFHEDRTGNIWVGTLGGLARYDGRVYTHYTKKQGLLSNTPYALLEDCSRNIWMSSIAGVSKFDGKTFSHFTKENGIKASAVFSLLEDRSGNIWMGSVGSIYKYNGKTLTTYGEKEGLGPFAVLCIKEDRKGQIWLGSGGGGLMSFNGKAFTHYTTAQGLSSNFVLTMVEDRMGHIWVGTDGGGISRFDGKRFIHYEPKDGLSNNFVYTLLEDRDGLIWAGTNGGGLSCFNGKTFMNLTMKNGLSSDVVQGLMEDRAGNIWVGTRFGITKISKKGGQTFGSKLGKRVLEPEDFIFRKYTFQDGFIGVGCNRNAMAEDSRGRIWIGTNDRLTVLTPEALQPVTKTPVLEITSLDFFNDEINWIALAKNRDTTFVLGNGAEVGRIKFEKLTPWTHLPENLSLHHKNNFLTFRFSAIALSQPQNVVYQYRMDGIDENWSPPSPKADAKYGNIPPGNYTFRVKAMNSEGLWSKESKISFSIRPPWWRSLWAYFLYLPALFFLLLGFFRWRTGNLIKQRSNLVKEVENATRIIKAQKEDVDFKNEQLALQKDEADKQKEQIEHAHRQLEKKNLEIISSIAYARRIQSAIMPPAKMVKLMLQNSFIMHRPKDIVAGDFYWVEQLEEKIFMAVCDCTGHGVPGAMVSVVCNNVLNRAVNEFGERLPGQILDKTRSLLLENFARSVVEVSDGMDASLAVLDTKTNKLLWAGANNPLWVVHFIEGKPELIEFKPDKQPIGRSRVLKPFTTHEITLREGDCFYLFTDGYADQFGGKKGKKMTKAGFKKYLLSICHLPMEKQHKSLLDYHNSYRGVEDQVDDICVIGVQV